MSDYMHTSQLLYNLVPLVACLGDDPYLETFTEGKLLLAQYYDMSARVHIDLIRRAIVQRIT